MNSGRFTLLAVLALALTVVLAGPVRGDAACEVDTNDASLSLSMLDDGLMVAGPGMIAAAACGPIRCARHDSPLSGDRLAVTDVFRPPNR